MPERADPATDRRLARDLLAAHLATAVDSSLAGTADADGLEAAVAAVEALVAVSSSRADEVVAAARALDGPARVAAWSRARDAAEVPGAARPADVVVAEHERATAAAADRRTRGSWYTPGPLVDLLLDRTLDAVLAEGTPADRIRVLDPACGSGRFLLAAHRRLVVAGATAPLGVVRGVDADPDAVEVLRLALWLELADPAVGADALAAVVAHGDALPATTTAAGAPPLDWVGAFPDVLGDDRDHGASPPGFDLVVGNPPFANALRGAGPVGRSAAAALAERFEGDVSGYANPAVAFLALAVDLARPDGGRVAFVQPLSTLAARDAGPVRARLLARATLDGVWVDGTPVFDAGVRTCAVLARRGGPADRPRCWVGIPAVEVTVSEATTVPDRGDPTAPWGPLVAPAFGVPAVVLPTSPTLGALGQATADFRDQYYGLAPAVVDVGPDVAAADLPPGLAPLATSGLIGVGACWWGQRPVRLHKQPRTAPAVDLARLAGDAAMAHWAESRLVPKVLVGTQGRVVEAFVDVDGRWLPSVPVITVVAEPEQLWAMAAALVSPATAAWAAAHRLGAALAPTAITLAARHIAQVPRPVDDAAWTDAADALMAAQTAATAGDTDAWRAALLPFADAAVAASGLDRATGAAVLTWWLDRLPAGGGRPPQSGRLSP